MPDEDGWHSFSEKRVADVTLLFKSLLRQIAQSYADMDQSSVVTDGHVNEAAKSIMRGARKMSIGKKILLALLRLFGGGLAAVSFKEAITATSVSLHVKIFFFCGVILFICAEYIDSKN